jgi:transcriptional regulator with XRE-family HTH domain
MPLPGLRLRQARESLDLTYRDVERGSYELAERRGRPEFILHISRLADIENHGVVPSLHKLYTLAVLYHLHPSKIAGWYEAPLENFIDDAIRFPAPKTSLFSPSGAPANEPVQISKPFDKQDTTFLYGVADRCRQFEAVLGQQGGRYRYACIGLSDRRMVPLLRPGSAVLVDVAVRHIEDEEWSTEYDRPMYFVELRDGYRCGWFQLHGTRLVMQPHPLSRCLPEVWRTPEDAEVVGRVVGVVTRLNEPWEFPRAESQATRGGLNRKAL